MTEKLRECFDEMVVYKNLRKSNFFSALSLPSFMRDWLLKMFCDDEGNFDADELNAFIKQYLPRKEDWTAIKNSVIMDRERVKFLAKISIDIDVRTAEISFSLGDFGLTGKETMIDEYVWQNCKDDLLQGQDAWGMIEIAYRPPDDEDFKSGGKIRLVSFKPFCPYKIDLDYYKDSRSEFEISEWLDVLLGAMDYNAAGYAYDEERHIDEEEQKLTMLTRLLPFVEKKLNLIEFAPKGTGKSYVYGGISRFGWLSTGGVMSRAIMFYDLSKRKEGLIAGNDFVVLDEVQKNEFTDVGEMQAALQGYLENGVFRVGNYEGVATAGMVLCGNIQKKLMDANGFANMFGELPKVFHESALIDRFHGFIKGWNIPRMNDDLKMEGWALNSEYFCSIMHELRDDLTYRTIVDELIIVPKGADTRDTEAVKRVATAYLKLLFPYVRTAEDISARDFRVYCLDRAVKMRDVIRYQLGELDVEYRGKGMPLFEIRN
ncbi:MAG: BREX system Lon protease-like protein BrxL [Defluviitaleaceae bacterium]|nr:BREX system Lon protease-like protein BrxL [Defluviitaleaceae bacterium]